MTREISHAMTAQDCLVALMVAISVSDETIRTSELVKINQRLITCQSSQNMTLIG